ncbi:MAG: PPC domain-containing protein [Spirochaetaceae bacterium]|jgi:hypothetical protein|nr:PPC domain-containing protein [Spirochaetaceae bacterium]
MIQRKHGLMAVLALLSYILPVLGQAQIHSVADLDKENALAASQIKQFRGIGEKTIVIAQFSSNSQVVPLGNYWKQNLINQLSGSGGLRILQGPVQGDYEINGEIVVLGETVRISTRLIDKTSSVILASWVADLGRTAYLEELIQTGGSFAARDMYEEDSHDNPVTLTLNQPITRTLHEEDQDWFVITPGENTAVSLETRGSIDTVMELYEGTSRLTQDDDGGTGENAKITAFLEGGKTYGICVKAYSSDITGTYELIPSLFEAPDKALEPNNTFDTAVSIQMGNSLDAFLSSGDEDWYSFTLDNRGTVSIDTSGGLDTLLALFDAHTTVLSRDDDSGSGGNARIIKLLEPGKYYIMVREYDRNSGAYTLNTQTRTARVNVADSYERDNAAAEATEIRFGEPQRHNFTNSADTDWVFFTVTTTGTYLIQAHGERDASLDTYITLYDGDKTEIDWNDDGGEGYSSWLQRRLNPGTYYIQVQCLDDNDPEDLYLLSVTALTDADRH